MIGIIIAAPIALSPFAKKYITLLEQRKIPYEIIEWVRSDDKSPSEKYHTFYEHTERYVSIFSKVMPFLHFRKFAKEIIKRQNYDRLIVLTTQTAVILFDVLRQRKYKNNYFFDYRDTSYEYIRLYRHMIDRIILDSDTTCISSYGFQKYLTTKKELIIAHNFQEKYYQERVFHIDPPDKSQPIILGYIGYLREYEYLKKFVDLFGADQRFEFHIHGSGDCENQLRDYVKKYKNVSVFGAYREEDKMKIVDSFDMICYHYPYSFVNYPAIANKFYDGLIRKKPLFANLDTFSGELVTKYGLGIALRENDADIPQQVYDYFMGLERAEFEKNCEDFLSRVVAEDKLYTKKINEFLGREKVSV